MSSPMNALKDPFFIRGIPDLPKVCQMAFDLRV
jgi:hypothetical protein